MFSDRRTVLALVAVALFLGACGQLPRPFARDGDEITTPEAMHPADGAGVVVDASRCAAAAAPALADAVVDALRLSEVPAGSTGGNRGSLRLTCAETDGALGWTLTGADGATIGAFTQAVSNPDLAAGGPGIFAALGDDAALEVLALLGRDMPLTQRARRPSLLVTPVAGAPGNGGVALARAMEVALEWQGATLAIEADDHAFLVLGSVALSDAESGAQRVEVVWEVLRPDGQRLGVVSQVNTVPHGALDGEWGPIAAAIARGGAQGVIDLLDRIAP